MQDSDWQAYFNINDKTIEREFGSTEYHIFCSGECGICVLAPKCLQIVENKK
ncbi:MAG: hypothetical protein ACFFG0_04885 [Candidatus Thorarchaeota archaeon]